MSAGVGLAAIGIGMSLYSSMKGSSAAKKAAAQRYMALKSQAELMRKLSKQDAARILEQMPRVLGQQAAGYAASGVRVNVGSPMAVAYDTVYQINRDVYQTIWNAEMKARAVEQGANVAVTEGNAMANQYTYQGINSALNMAASAYFNYAELQAKGGGTPAGAPTAESPYVTEN